MVGGSGVGGPITLFVACQLNGGVPTEGRFAGLGLPSLPATREVNLHWTFPFFISRQAQVACHSSLWSRVVHSCDANQPTSGNRM